MLSYEFRPEHVTRVSPFPNFPDNREAMDSFSAKKLQQSKEVFSTRIHHTTSMRQRREARSMIGRLFKHHEMVAYRQAFDRAQARGKRGHGKLKNNDS